MVHLVLKTYYMYHKGPKFLDRQVSANTLNPDQTNQGLHCLSISLQLLDILLYNKTTLIKF